MIELGKLESHLWEAANILRGPVDAADFKTYIFPLLFFKRISDVYDEELSNALGESQGDMEFALFPENHRFQIPSDCHWQEVRARSENLGHALHQAMRGIEQANPDTLHGIFGDAQWTNKDRLSDALLKDLIEHFSALNLGNENCRADVLGQSYEYLIKKFADLTNKKAGEFYTPRPVVSLMVRILAPEAGDTVYDPACGTGGMLLEALHHVKEQGGDENLMLGNLYGQEKNLTTSAIARMNLFLHGAEDFYVERGDTLRQPAYYSGDGLARFDCVIANPPFSLEKWGDDLWTADPYGRNFAGLPPAKSGDFAWVQHMIRSMAPKTGRMAVVLPHGVLFRACPRRVRSAASSWRWTSSKPSSAWDPTSSTAPASPPASSCSAKQSPSPTSRECCLSTPRASSSRAAPKTSSRPHTFRTSTACTRSTGTSKAFVEWWGWRRSGRTTSTSTSPATSSP